MTLQNFIEKKGENICLLCTNRHTSKYCKFILNYSDMFLCQYTIFREFTVVLAKVMNH